MVLPVAFSRSARHVLTLAGLMALTHSSPKDGSRWRRRSPSVQLVGGGRDAPLLYPAQGVVGEQHLAGGRVAQVAAGLVGLDLGEEQLRFPLALVRPRGGSQHAIRAGVAGLVAARGEGADRAEAAARGPSAGARH